jgi:hypothetical protein
MDPNKVSFKHLSKDKTIPLIVNKEEDIPDVILIHFSPLLYYLGGGLRLEFQLDSFIIRKYRCFLVYIVLALLLSCLKITFL